MLIAFALRAISAIPARSEILSSGFDGVSTDTSRVAGRTAERTACKSVMSTYVTSNGHFAKTVRNTCFSP